MKQGSSRHSEDYHSISYTRLIQAEEEEELRTKQEQQANLAKRPEGLLSVASNPWPSQQMNGLPQMCLLDTIVSQDGPNIKVHSPKDKTWQEVQNHYQDVRYADGWRGGGDVPIKKTVLKSIQQNEMEYKRSDSSQKSMLESQIVNHVVISNIAKAGPLSPPPQSSTQSNPLPTKIQMPTTNLKPSQNHLFQSLPLNEVYIRPINDSREIRLEDLEQGPSSGQEEAGPEVDKVTLRVTGSYPKPTLLTQSPEGRVLLSSLVTSKNRGNEKKMENIDDFQHQQEHARKQRSSSMKKLMILKLRKIEEIVAEKKEALKDKGKEKEGLKDQGKEEEGLNDKGKNVFGVDFKEEQSRTQSSELLDCILSLSIPKLSALLKAEIDQLNNLCLNGNKQPAPIQSPNSNQEIALPLSKQVKLVSKNGYFYLGQMKEEDQRKNRGLEVAAGEYAYCGSFRGNNKEGFGKIVYYDHSIYQGDWASNRFHGHGTYTSSTGETYQGIFEAGNKSGFGREWLSNGDSYEGEFNDNLFHGQGIYKWRNGSLYRGSFLNNKMHGKGEWISNKGDRYIGDYREGMKEGRGTYLWSNGAVYQGTFRRGKPASHRRKPEKDLLFNSIKQRVQEEKDKNHRFRVYF